MLCSHWKLPFLVPLLMDVWINGSHCVGSSFVSCLFELGNSEVLFVCCYQYFQTFVLFPPQPTIFLLSSWVDLSILLLFLLWIYFRTSFFVPIYSFFGISITTRVQLNWLDVSIQRNGAADLSPVKVIGCYVISDKLPMIGIADTTLPSSVTAY